MSTDREGERTSGAAIRISPVYGFAITSEMGEQLITPDPSAAEFGEEMHMYGSREQGLILGCAWQADRSTQLWFRIDSTWVPDDLDNNPRVVEDSRRIEALRSSNEHHLLRPWSGPLLLAEWDGSPSLPTLYPALGAMPPGKLVTRADLNPQHLDSLDEEAKRLWPVRRLKDLLILEQEAERELELLQLAHTWAGTHEGPPTLTAQDVLAALITGHIDEINDW